MKKKSFLYLIPVLFLVFFIGCSKDDDGDTTPTPPPIQIDFTEVEIQDFIWKGMNLYYLWKDDVPNLANAKDDNDESYFNLLKTEQDPDAFFESLIYQRGVVDRDSWIVDDYVALENSFQGISKSNGVKYKLYLECSGCSTIMGVVRYILPDSDASDKDVKRGYIFNSIDGQQLTTSNYQDLLNQDSYIMNFADLTGGELVSNGKSTSLTKEENLVENPFHIVKTFDVDGIKIGYIMYNGFDGGFEDQMNEAFAQLQSEGATELILDLRYNPGGYGYVAKDLATAITGQFKGELLKKERWNAELQAWLETNHPEWIEDLLSDKFSQKDVLINSLHMNNLYVITSSSTASASEVIISGLDPYINVVTVGDLTYGKYTGSITVYDSDNFSKTGDNLNPNHKWAMQLIALEYVNNLGATVKGGIPASVIAKEHISDFAELGNQAEPLLAATIATITGSGVSAKVDEKFVRYQEFESKLDFERKGNTLRIKKELPKGLDIRQ